MANDSEKTVDFFNTKPPILRLYLNFQRGETMSTYAVSGFLSTRFSRELQILKIFENARLKYGCLGWEDGPPGAKMGGFLSHFNPFSLGSMPGMRNGQKMAKFWNKYSNPDYGLWRADQERWVKMAEKTPPQCDIGP